MICVTVRLISAVDPSHDRILGTMFIANDGTGTQDIGNYNAVLNGEYTPPEGRTCKISGFKRKKQSVWTLIGMALKAMGHAK